MALQRLNRERRGLGRHNDKGNNRGVASRSLEAVVQPGQRLDEHVDTLISEFVTTGCEDIDGVIRVKVVVAIKVTSNEIVDLLLGNLMQVLEFVDRRELCDVQAVRQHTVRLALEQMLRLKCSDVRYSGEDVARMGGSALNAVAVVDTALTSLGVDIKVLKVVVKVNGAGAKVSTEKSSVSGEDGGDVDAALLGQRQSNTGKPLVKVSNDGLVLLVTYKLVKGVSCKIKQTAMKQRILPRQGTKQRGNQRQWSR